MRIKALVSGLIVFIVSSGFWGGYVLSRRAFVRDLNGGVKAFLDGNYAGAAECLEKALARRPGNHQARELLVKALVEESFLRYHHKDFDGAVQPLTRALALTSPSDQAHQALSALKSQLAPSPDAVPVPMKDFLRDLYRKLPSEGQPLSVQAAMQEWLEQSRNNQEQLIRRLWQAQERWLENLEHEKDQFRRLLYGGLALFAVGGMGLAIVFVGVLQAYFGRRGVVARLLQEHHQRLISSLPMGSQVFLGPPTDLQVVPGMKQIDAIEAELVKNEDTHRAQEMLRNFLKEEDPWVRARAAKALYQFDPKASLEELRKLVNDSRGGTQVPGLWALSELASSEAMDVLVSLVDNPSRDIQQAAVRCLVQLQERIDLPLPIREQLRDRLAIIRSKTGWII
ncbi:MAG: HEAT repeat domain-containing protein [Elusimicrobiota bacterium]|jgi:tetratricopeptide (TPR) repeat protein